MPAALRSSTGMPRNRQLGIGMQRPQRAVGTSKSEARCGGVPKDDRERAFSGSRRRWIESGEAGIQMNKRFVGVLTFAFLVAAGASLVLYRVLINRPATGEGRPPLAQVALATKISKWAAS